MNGNTFKDLYLRKAVNKEKLFDFVNYYETSTTDITLKVYLGFNDTEYDLFLKGEYKQLFTLMDKETHYIRLGDYVEVIVNGKTLTGWITMNTLKNHVVLSDSVDHSEIWVDHDKPVKLTYKQFPLTI